MDTAFFAVSDLSEKYAPIFHLSGKSASAGDHRNVSHLLLDLNDYYDLLKLMHENEAIILEEKIIPLT